jgi:N-methylhydantoinase B
MFTERQQQQQLVSKRKGRCGVFPADGVHNVGHVISLGGLTLPNVEGYEQAYPVRIHRQELRRDTAGAGEFRGGAGVDYICDVLVPTEHAVRSEGVGRPSGYGIGGGLDGSAGLLDVEEIGKGPCPSPQYGIQRLGPTRIRVQSSAGGGWGDPCRRDPDAVLADVLDGIVSEEMALNIYGVVLTRDGHAVDHARTTLHRASASKLVNAQVGDGEQRPGQLGAEQDQ